MPNSTPIIINNFNRLSTTVKLFKDLVKLNCNNIYIIDNQSTYKQLLSWYNDIKNNKNIKVIPLDKNYGSRALWDSGFIENFKDEEYIVYTDSDLQLNSNTPENFIYSMIKLSKEYKFDKVGLAIEINDLPNNFMGQTIRKTEASYWINKLPHRYLEVYQGLIDTTFAVIKPTLPFQYHALRVAGNYTCKHVPWYSDFNNLSNEEKYMIKTADPNVSTFIQHYNKWLNETKGDSK